MQREQLEAMTRDELRVLAKEHDIPGRGNMTKVELVQALMTSAVTESVTGVIEERRNKALVEDTAGIVYEPVVDIDTLAAEVGVDVEVDADAEATIAKENSQEQERIERHRQIVEAAEIGAIVAFSDEAGKCRSAKIVNKSSKRQVVKLQTNYGAEFVVPYKNIVWVKSGARWPRGIYNKLKGIDNDANNQATNEAASA